MSEDTLPDICMSSSPLKDGSHINVIHLTEDANFEIDEVNSLPSDEDPECETYKIETELSDESFSLLHSPLDQQSQVFGSESEFSTNSSEENNISLFNDVISPNNAIMSHSLVKSVPSLNRMDEVSPNISPMSSPSASVLSTCTGSKWLESVNLDLKHIDTKINISSNYETKVKKVKLSGKFSEQAFKVKNREKSLKTVWLHERLTQSEENCQALTLKILNSSVENGIVFKNCELINSNSELVNTNVETSRSLLACQPNSKSIGENEPGLLKINHNFMSDQKNNFILLVDLETHNKIKLCNAEIIKLFYPWQKLHLDHEPNIIILCAYFIDQVERIIDKDKSILVECHEEVLFKWSCSCRKNFYTRNKCFSYTEI